MQVEEKQVEKKNEMQVRFALKELRKQFFDRSWFFNLTLDF